METIVEFLKHTPIWVYFIFAYFLIQGIFSLKPRNVSIKRVFILPIVLTLITWSSVSELLLWLSASLLGGWLGWKWMRNLPLTIDVKNKGIKLPGSPFPLFLFLSIFAIKYAFGALHAIDPDTYLKMATYQSLLSGLFIGLSWGRSLTIGKIYHQEIKSVS